VNSKGGDVPDLAGQPAAGPRRLELRGARANNLRAVDLSFPHGVIVAFTGRSGSGKSSLAVDTIMAEAHRRSVQSMSAYARQFAAQFARPPLDHISGLCTAVFIDQGQVNRNPRSTLGTSTDIFDLLRVLFARFGRPVGPDAPAERLDPKDFSFNLPFGACPGCEGLGSALAPDPDLVVPDPSRSVVEGALAAHGADRFAEVYTSVAVALCEQQGADPKKSWRDLPAELRETLLFTPGTPVRVSPPGGEPWETSYVGACPWLSERYRAADSDAARAKFAAFMHASDCADCRGSRLGPAPRSYRLGDVSIDELCAMSLTEAAAVIERLVGDPAVTGAHDLLQETGERLRMLTSLGLGYLSLDRAAPSLSGGEGQRARLATQLATGLFGLMYVLDEPSAGLHPHDTGRLVSALQALRDQGNSVLVVEHDQQLIRASDWVVDVGPGAGREGGRVLFSGPFAELAGTAGSVTAQCLADEHGRVRRAPRERTGALTLTGARAHNLSGVDVELPLGLRVAVTGVSGSGKSTLVRQVMLPALRSLGVRVPDTGLTAGHWHSARLDGRLERVIVVDQAPIGRNSRSNPATYVGVFDAIRKLFAALPAARSARLSAKHFSFNLPDGRCPECSGEGVLRIEMQFLPDAVVPCAECEGRRYTDRVLAVRRNDRSIADVLDLSVDQAREEFASVSAVARPLATLSEIGLGYLRLGQPAPSLSGGEAQRLKLANELQQPPTGGSLYLLDEPTTGLHMADVDRLTATLDQLVDRGHSVVVVEHDPDLVASSDWVIDLGPGGGRDGGRVVVAGPPERVARTRASRTGRYLRR
jgi:excinuclease ABC subunit A